MTAGSFGLRVSKSSTTRGRPPVMSLVLVVARGIADKNRRLMFFIAGRQRNDVLGEAGNFVDLLFNRQAGPQVVELHGAGGFGKDREGERIPFGKNLAVRDAFAFGDAQARAVNDVVAFLFAVL